MALRLLELTVHDDDGGLLPGLLDGVPILQRVTMAAGSETSLVRLLVDAGQVERLSDSLVDALGKRDGFRLVVLPVEATLPAVEPTKTDDAAEPEAAAASSGDALRISRDELYQDLTQASRLTWVYGVMVALSTVVAAVGLIRDDVAIVIGAMVIAPLLGPNVALALACTLGDLDLARRSLKAAGAGVAIVVALSVPLGAVLRVDPATPELAARTGADVSDIALALAAGAAGSLAFTTGVPAAVVGVMVAVALLPPLVAAGLLAGAGYAGPAAGALVLVATNVTCVNLAAVATFLLQKVRPRTWWEAEQAKRATRIAVTVWILLLVALSTLMLLGLVGGVPPLQPSIG